METNLREIKELQNCAVLTVQQDSMQMGDQGVMQSLIGTASGYRILIVDLHQVVRLDSLGIGAIVRASAACREQGGRMVLAGASDHVKNILRHGYADLRIYATAEDAVRDLKK